MRSKYERGRCCSSLLVIGLVQFYVRHAGYLSSCSSLLVIGLVQLGKLWSSNITGCSSLLVIGLVQYLDEKEFNNKVVVPCWSLVWYNVGYVNDARNPVVVPCWSLVWYNNYRQTQLKEMVVVPCWSLVWYNFFGGCHTVDFVVVPCWSLVWYNRKRVSRFGFSVVVPCWSLVWYNCDQQKPLCHPAQGLFTFSKKFFNKEFLKPYSVVFKKRKRALHHRPFLQAGISPPTHQSLHTVFPSGQPS